MLSSYVQVLNRLLETDAAVDIIEEANKQVVCVIQTKNMSSCIAPMLLD